MALAMLYVSVDLVQFPSFDSLKVCQIMRMHDVTFTGHNVLADEELRQGIKEFSNWPTIPQVNVLAGGKYTNHVTGALMEANFCSGVS